MSNRLDEYKKVLDYTDVPHVEAEILGLPITSTTYDFLIRFTAPIKTVLMGEPIRVSGFAAMSGPLTLDDLIKEAILNRYQDMIKDSSQGELTDEEQAFMDKLKNRDEVIFHQLKLVRDNG